MWPDRADRRLRTKMHTENRYYTPDLYEDIDVLRPFINLLRKGTGIEQCNDGTEYVALHNRMVKRMKTLTTALLTNGLIECIAGGRMIKAPHFATCWESYTRQPFSFTNAQSRRNEDQTFNQTDRADQRKRSKLSPGAESVSNSFQVRQSF